MTVLNDAGASIEINPSTKGVLGPIKDPNGDGVAKPAEFARLLLFFDRRFTLPAVRRNGLRLVGASHALRADRETVLCAVGKHRSHAQSETVALHARNRWDELR